MACFRLTTYNATPPGGYIFPKPTGGNWSEPMIEAVAGQVSTYRKMNGLPRSTMKEALADVDHYTCQRLGGMSAFCVPCNSSAPDTIALGQSSPIVAGPCRGCGAPVP